MPERQLALTGRPEIFFSGRGYKAACMNDVILQRTITLDGLMERWAGKRVGDYALDFEGIRELVRQTDQLPAYVLLRQLAITGGNRVCKAIKISYADMMRELREKPGFYAVLFNLDDVEKFELDNFHKEKGEGGKLEGGIAIWRKAMDNFVTDTEKKIALVVIGKFQGKTHTDICGEVFGNNIADPIGKIKKLKVKAQAIAKKHGLPMPEWNSRNK